MQTTSALYQSIFSGLCKREWRATVNDSVYDESYIVRSVNSAECIPKITQTAFQRNNSEIGNAVAATLTITFLLPSASIPKSASVKMEYRLVNKNSQSEWIPAGTFFVDTRREDEESGTTALTCYDAMLKADRKYIDETRFDTWPVSMDSVVSEISELIGAEIDFRTTINSGTGYKVEYPNDLTMREVLEYVAVAHAGNFVITPAGKLRLVPITGNSDTVDALAATNGFKTAPAFPSWTGVDVYWDDEEAFEAGTRTGRMMICDCPWAKQATADGILSVIIGNAYQPFSASDAIIDPAFEVGDILSFGDFNASVFDIAITCDEVCHAALSAPWEAEEEHEYPTQYLTKTEREMKRKVSLGKSYYGTSISREKGIEIARSDGTSEAVFNSDTFAMRALIDGIMQDRIYFDAEKGDYIFNGALGADAVFTDSLYAENGDVAELSVDRLTTSRRIRKYILQDLSDDNFVRIQDHYIQFVTGTLIYDVALESAPPVQAVNRFNRPLYWQREPVGRTYDGYPLDVDGVQIYATTDETDWPVYVYAYHELVKAQFAFEQYITSGGVQTYAPIITLGAGDERGRSKGFISKLASSLRMWFTTRDGRENGIKIGNYTDLYGIRKPTALDFSAWDSGIFTETLDGELTGSFTITFDESDNPVSFTDGDGHVTEVMW